MTRCRICSSNDEETLIEDVARAMWLTQESSSMDAEWRVWENAGPYWQTIMKQFAAATIKTLRHPH